MTVCLWLYGREADAEKELVERGAQRGCAMLPPAMSVMAWYRRRETSKYSDSAAVRGNRESMEETNQMKCGVVENWLNGVIMMSNEKLAGWQK